VASAALGGFDGIIVILVTTVLVSTIGMVPKIAPTGVAGVVPRRLREAKGLTQIIAKIVREVRFATRGTDRKIDTTQLIGTDGTDGITITTRNTATDRTNHISWHIVILGTMVLVGTIGSALIVEIIATFVTSGTVAIFGTIGLRATTDTNIFGGGFGGFGSGLGGSGTGNVVSWHNRHPRYNGACRYNRNPYTWTAIDTSVAYLRAWLASAWAARVASTRATSTRAARRFGGKRRLWRQVSRHSS
jgi:hypothetical protein